MRIRYVKKHILKILPMLAFVALTNSLSAGILYIDRPFDYAGSLTNGDCLTDSVQWTGDTSLILWNELGLEQSWLGDESGGSMQYDPSSDVLRYVDTDLDTILTYIGYAEGSTFWFTAVFRTEVVGTINDSTKISFCANRAESTDVNRLTFIITGTNAYCKAFTNGGADAYIEIKVSSNVTAQQTHMFLARLTLGTPGSPTNSKWDFWFNPTNTYTAANLGAPDGTIPASKGGRNLSDYKTEIVNVSFSGWTNNNYPRWDEIRAGDTFFDVVRLPNIVNGTTVIIR